MQKLKAWPLKLNLLIQPFVLRRTKENVLQELPPKTEQVILLWNDRETKRALRYEIKNNAIVLEVYSYT